MNRACTPPRKNEAPPSVSPVAMCHHRLFAHDDDESVELEPTDERLSWSVMRPSSDNDSAPADSFRPSRNSTGLTNVQDPNAFNNANHFASLGRCGNTNTYTSTNTFSTPRVGGPPPYGPANSYYNNNSQYEACEMESPGRYGVLETPEIQRMTEARMTGGDFGTTIAPAILCTPQIAPSVLHARHSFNSELDAANATYRAYAPPLITTLIPDFLYIGACPEEESVELLRGMGVRYIVNCCVQDVPLTPEIRDAFEVYTLQCPDVEDYLILLHHYEAFEGLLNRIASEGEKVFVHCIAGINRSVVLCAAYLMSLYRLDPCQVIEIFHKNGRMRLLENVGFRNQLIDHYYQNILNES
ncbi:protein phosphatase [Angomonas deanei]|uniref:protein-tyrosine-phosphatase n=1 Tax=Angomonas deanei TaxID=59799 RepID=A0A7G2CCW1_9TRYP|nr:protein phosphatase [Angomonas deanei]CAD2216553.1 Dual specificity phosphatase, catalytic domain containing protein, putative [Angomonas deanei]|eukprot:EPY33966.1 protein phosphatase [Angomonas deanei]